MVVEVNGIELYCETFGEGEPLLWLHGGMGFGADWRHIFKEPPAGYRLIAPDLRGHGSSTNPSGTFSFRQCARDIRALLHHLQIPRVKAIGLSGGGIIDVNFTPPYLSTITADTLIVFGDRDPLYPVSLAVELGQAIPRSYLWVVPNGAHGPIFGDAAPRFVATALEFLRGSWRQRQSAARRPSTFAARIDPTGMITRAIDIRPFRC